MRSAALILNDVCEGRNNHLNLIRMVAAGAVLISHAWPISLGPKAVQPMEASLGLTLGTLAVYTFFIISGFLVARSFERQPTVWRWMSARALRLFPALFVVLVLTVLVLGPFATDLAPKAYFTHSMTLTYVPRNLSLAFLQYPLPGAFLEQPYPGAINGSLWTLFYEVVCYGGVLVGGLLGLLRFRRRMLLGFGGVALSYAFVFHVLDPSEVPYRLGMLMGLALPFAVGTAFYVWRDLVWLHPVGLAGLALLTAMAARTPLYLPLLVLALAYGTFLLAHTPSDFALRYNRLGDYSYGIYIYAFPMQQLMVHLFQPMTPFTNIALALPPTLMLAVLSWHWIEKPALSLGRRPLTWLGVRATDKMPSL